MSTYQPIIYDQSSGTPVLVGNWPQDWVLGAHAAGCWGTSADLCSWPDADDPTILWIKIGDQTAAYQQVGAAFSGGTAYQLMKPQPPDTPDPPYPFAPAAAPA